MSIEIPDRLFQELLVCRFLMKEEIECTCSSNYFGKTLARQSASHELSAMNHLVRPELRLFGARDSLVYACLNLPANSACMECGSE